MDPPKVLILSHIDLDYMPDLSQVNETTIYLEKNDIHIVFSEYLPERIAKLYAGYNRLSSDGLPNEWPVGLEEIHVDHNYIQDTDGIDWPENLKLLNLSGNPLKYWPNGLPDGLQTFFLNKTDITMVDPLPSGLKQFFVRSAKIKHLPTALPEGLQILIASNNFLRSSRLPQDWGSSLQQLNLSKNSLTSFPKGLPNTLRILALDDNQINEIPSDLPQNLEILLIRGNKVQKIQIEARTKPIAWVMLDDNQLTESVRDYQEKKKIQWANTITENWNWNQQIHHKAATMIRKKWRSYKLRRRLRTWRKTSQVKTELQQVSMHPSRAGRFENISSEWGWGWGC
jgi:Leucine-rich repeat (LRR) protein